MRTPRHLAACLAATLLAVNLLACGGGSSPPPTAPSIPTSVQATPSLRKITITWDPSTGGATGYNVYRSADGLAFARRNAAAVPGTSYDDALVSPQDDGVTYTYRVTAVGGLESDPSATTRAMHGTRVAGTYAAGFTTEAAGSPYVVAGAVTVEAGNFTIAAGTKVYVLDGAVIDVAAGIAGDGANGNLLVRGLLRVLASPQAHATFTSHKAGGLGSGEGFTLVFDHAPDFVPSDGSGTLIQNTDVNGLRAGGNLFQKSLQFLGSAPKFLDCRLTVLDPPEATYALVETGVIFEHCAITGIYLSIQANLSATNFKVEHCVLRSTNFRNYVLEFVSVADPLGPGQFTLNDIDGTWQLDLGAVSGGDVRLEGNYWTPGVPSIRRQAGTPDTLGVVFAPVLDAPPAGVGPSW